MLLTNSQVESPDFNHLGYVQADLHRRQANDARAEEHIRARARLICRFTPFILYADRNLDPTDLMETVANRLFAAAAEERARRKQAA